MVEFKDLKQDGSYEVLEKVDLPHDVKCGSQIIEYNFCGECGELLKPQSSEMLFNKFKRMITDI